MESIFKRYLSHRFGMEFLYAICSKRYYGKNLNAAKQTIFSYNHDIGLIFTMNYAFIGVLPY